MKDFFDFATANPWLVFALSWGIWPICWMIQAIVLAPFNLIFRMWNRTLRSHNIRAQGWPTAPFMDADGDIVHPPVDKE